MFREQIDKQYSFTDCTAFVLMRRLSLTAAAALDDDFAQEGFERRAAEPSHARTYGQSENDAP